MRPDNGLATPTSCGAYDRIRTGDLFLTKEVLYRLSYIGKTSNFWKLNDLGGTGRRAGNGIRTRDIQLGRLTLCQLSYSR